MTKKNDSYESRMVFRAIAISRLAEIEFGRLLASTQKPILKTISLPGGNLELTISCLERYLMWLTAIDDQKIAEKYDAAMILIEIQFISNDPNAEVYETSESIVVREDNCMLLAASTIAEVLQGKEAS